MYFLAFLFPLVVHLPVTILAQSLPVSQVSPQALNSFNESIGGRLFTAEPLAAPCFSSVNGVQTLGDMQACAAVQLGYRSPEFLSQQFSAYMFCAWTNMTCFQGQVPRYAFEIQTPEDVAKAFDFARTTRCRLSIKNSGHDFKGRSSMSDSLSLWTRKLDKLAYNPSFIPVNGSTSYPVITVGAGATWESVYAFADSMNVTVIGGYHQTVGASGGWIMGGGHSVLTPVYGLGVDRVVQFRVVTPDGVFRTVNANIEKDLFFALRGGGGSTFGVVMETSYIVEPKMKLQTISVSFPQTPENGLDFLRLVIDQSSQWGKEGWGGMINVNPLLSLDQAIASMKPITDFVQSQNGTVVIEELPSWYAFFEKYVLVAEASVGLEFILGTRLIPTSMRFITFLASLGPTLKWAILLTTPTLYKNYTNDLVPASITPAWRDSLYHLSTSASFAFNSTIQAKHSQFALVSNATRAMQDLTPGSGSYFNEGDVYERDHEESYWGSSNYKRLVSIKRA
ncbi:FAD-binding domain-containing protein [Mycena floridula]|nr:FAD-binding domain-containing protein [Mycena floridula]